MIWDTFSRLILGFAVTWRRESWTTAALAILHMATDKTEFCNQYGLDCPVGSWPHSLFETALSDNGAMIAMLRENFRKTLALNFDNTAANRPDMKPVVEGGFHWLNEELIYHLPGAIHRAKGIRETKECLKRARRTASLTIHELTKRLTAQCQYHNSHLIEGYPLTDDMLGVVAPVPIELWNYGVARNMGTVRWENPDVLRMHCLCRDQATVCGDGIIFRQKPYSCSVAEANGWMVRGRQKRWKIPILYHPLDLSAIYWVEHEARQGELPKLVQLKRIRTEGDFPYISEDELLRKQNLQATINKSYSEEDMARASRFAAVRGASPLLPPIMPEQDPRYFPSAEVIRHMQAGEDQELHTPALPLTPQEPLDEAVPDIARRAFEDDEVLLNQLMGKGGVR